MDLQGIGKLILVIALGLALLGGLLLVAGRLGLGSLPGDLRFGDERWGCYLPIATSLILSLLLTLVINVILRILR